MDDLAPTPTLHDLLARAVQHTRDGRNDPFRNAVLGRFARLALAAADAARRGHGDMRDVALTGSVQWLDLAGLWDPEMAALHDLAATTTAEALTVAADADAIAQGLMEKGDALRLECVLAVGTERGAAEMERVSILLGLPDHPWAAPTSERITH